MALGQPVTEIRLPTQTDPPRSPRETLPTWESIQSNNCSPQTTFRQHFWLFVLLFRIFPDKFVVYAT